MDYKLYIKLRYIMVISVFVISILTSILIIQSSRQTRYYVYNNGFNSPIEVTGSEYYLTKDKYGDLFCEKSNEYSFGLGIFIGMTMIIALAMPLTIMTDHK